ncbi:MAG: efflux RND transporter periplasmic adaptor subunit [Burkholderiales bacterium]|nr:efflux RND transporter periplasmic adaptor subunit [Burkholderiales bacterium]
MPLSRLTAFAAAASALLVLSGCQRAEPPAAPAPPPPPVTVIEVAPREVPVLVEVVGRTEGSKEVEVRARVSGVLERTLYAEGTPVRAGTPLFQIDRAPFEIALAQARAALAQERSRNEQAQREAQRLADLAARRAISQREADDAASALKTSNAALQAAEARQREAELNLSYTAIHAPIAGISGRALRSQGALVTAGSESSLLTTIAQTHPLWVRFAVSEAERQQLRGSDGGRGNEVRLLLPDGRTHAGAGRVNFAASTVDTRLGTVQLRAEVANPDLALLPGQFVRVQVVAGRRQAMTVPQSAVAQGDQGRFVWTLGAENKAVPRPVEAGAWLGRDWIIEKGLAAGDRVIVDNLLRLRPGVVVQPQAPGAAPAGAGPTKGGGQDKGADKAGAPDKAGPPAKGGAPGGDAGSAARKAG